MPTGYMEAVTDEQLIAIVESGISNSTSDWLNSSELSLEREKSTFEYAGIPRGHLAPQGVSSIVDTSTTENIEAYTAILSDLFLSNQRLARFVPFNDTPGAFQASRNASSIVNYCIFKQNNGWEIIEDWIKAALLWKNGIIRWDYVDEYDYEFEEYESITQTRLDTLLSEDNIEIVGDLELNDDMLADGMAMMSYVNVRLRRKVNKCRVKIELIPPENFRISQDAKSFEDADIVSIETLTTRSDLRKNFSEEVKDFDEDDWNQLSADEYVTGRFNQDQATRKEATSQNYNNISGDIGLEANQELTLKECWLKVDRDGDGIAELKQFIIAGSRIIVEKDVDMIPLASLSPVSIPFEFYGLSIADFTRSSTLAATAILRGFVENTYLTNYSPKLADPNVVDFSALQNIKPKQIIPTNGSPVGAVQSLQPETISTGTVPLLEYLQTIKEQGTGMSKAAQGLNDALYVSGNSEAKLQSVQSASQKRIQHIAKRFAETGFKRLCNGIYKAMRKNMNEKVSFNLNNVFSEIVPSELPHNLECEVFIDIGENSNANKIQKLRSIGSEILPSLQQSGAGAAVKAEASVALAAQIMESMGIDSNDYLIDYTTEEFKEQAAKMIQSTQEEAEKEKALLQEKAQTDLLLQKANVGYTDSQAQNTRDDNSRQMAIAIDKHFQQWSELQIKAAKEGVQLEKSKSFEDILLLVGNIMNPPPPPEAMPQEQLQGDPNMAPGEMMQEANINPAMMGN